MHYNTFFNNTATIGSAIYCDSGSVNATLNWWGSNSNPENQTEGNVNYSPWLYTTITADPNSISYGGTSNVTVSFNNAYNGTSIEILDPADGHIPDGTLVNFTTTLGTIDPAETTTTNGTTNTTFTATSTGSATVSATTDNETVSTEITVSKTSTTLTVNDVNGVNRETVNLTATLTDENGTTLADKTVEFTVNGTSAGSTTTDSNGIATLQYQLTSTGDFTLEAIFAGDNNYQNSNNTGTLHVDPAANLTLNTIISNNNPRAGENFIITYKLGNKGPDAAENVTITFTIPQGLEYVSIVVDTGTYTYDATTHTVTWTLDTVPVGDPYLYLTVRAASAGTYTITPHVTSDTYNWGSGSTGVISINVQAASGKKVNAKTNKTIRMQKTGSNPTGLILAILTILGAFAVPLKKK